MNSHFEQAAKKLLSDDFGEAHKAASDLRERIEIVHTHELGSFLKHFLPVFQELLTKRLPPQFTDNPTNRFRQIILEIFHRLPNNEVLKPYVKFLIPTLMEVIVEDNENAALMGLRIMFDLHKNFRTSLESEVRPFLDLARRIYGTFPDIVSKVFNPLCTSTAVEGVPTGMPERGAQATQQSPVSTLDAYSSSGVTPQQPPNLVHPQSGENVMPPSLAYPSVSTTASGERMDRHDAAGVASASAGEMKLLKSTESFKVLTECPLTIMLLFQLYPGHIQENVPKLVPLMIKALEVRVPPPMNDSHPDMHVRYKELISCQVKALSFLTYLLRGFSEILLEYEQVIADSVIILMNRCPRDATATRKELLVATRHILVTEFRRGFNGKIDGLLDTSVLLGSGPEASDVLRPLAFSTLADLVHHVRKTLTQQQLTTVVDMFTRNIHDCTLVITIQTTSIRLLFNLVDQIFYNTDRDPRIGKYLLIRIILPLVYKFKSLTDYIPRIMAADRIRREKRKMQELGSTPILESYMKDLQDSKEVSKEGTNFGSEVSAPPPPSTPSSLNEREDVPSNHEGGGGDHQPSSSYLISSEIDKCAMKELMIPSRTKLEQWNPPGAPRKQMLGGPETIVDSVKELKSLVKTMIVGLKTVIYCCNNYHQPKPGGEQKRQNDRHSQQATVMPEVERDLVSKAFRWALECLSISMECFDGTSHGGWKDLLDPFAGAFTVLQSYNFRMVVGPHIPLLFEILQRNPTLLNIPQYLLANLDTSATMVDILLCFLVQQMDDLAGYDPAGRRFVDAMNDFPGWKVGTAGTATSDVSCASPVSNEAVRYSTASVFDTHGVNVPNAPTATGTDSAADAKCDESSSEERKRADQRALILLRLFKVVFGSVALFSKNETVLRPHLQMLILSCLRYITRLSNPIHYLNLLRTLFRSISGGKFEQSYKEILPLLPLLLTELNELQKRSTDPVIRNLLVELCLTVPARLAYLLPYLPLMMRLIVRALTCQSDLEALALRTLEFWVDNLNPVYLYRMMSHDPQVLVDVMSALCDNLRPTPFPYGMSTLRLLGKIGGRCTHFLRLPMPIPQRNIDVIGSVSFFQANVNWPTGGGNTEGTGCRGDAERMDVIREENSAVARVTPSQPTAHLNLDSIVMAACRLMGDLNIKIKEKDTSTVLSLSQKSSPPYSDIVHSAVNKQVGELQNVLNLNQSSIFRFLVRCMSEVAGLDVSPISCDEIKPFVAPEYNSMDIGAELAKKRYEEIHQELDVEVDLQLEEQMVQKSNVVKQMLQAIVLSASFPNLNQEAVNVLRGLILNLMRITTPEQVDHTLFADISKVPAAPFDPFNDEKGFALDPPINEPFSPLCGISEYFQKKQIITPQELTEAMVSLLTYDAKEELQRVVLDCIHFVVSSSGVAAGSGRSGEGQMGRAVLHSLVVSLCSACFDMDWSKKIGASRGIRVVCECMSWQAARVFELRIMEALLYVMRDIPREKTVAIMEHVEMALIALLKTRYGDEFVLNPNSNFDSNLNMGRSGGDVTMVDANATNLTNAEKNKAAADDAVERTTVDDEAGRHTVCHLVVRLMAVELASFHHNIRSTVKWVLQVLSAVSKKSVAELLLPCKVNLHRRMFGKSLRTLQAFVQIGVLELLAYLFTLRSNDILPIDEPVLSILQDMMVELDTSSWSTPADGGTPSLYTTLSPSGGLPITPRGFKRGCLEHIFPFDTRNTARDTRNALELPSSLQFRVSSIRVMHAVIVNHGNVFSRSGPQKNLWHRFMNVIFCFVAGGSEHVVDTACMALADLMSTPAAAGGGGGGGGSGTQVNFGPEWKHSLEPLWKKLGSLSTLSLELFDELSRLLCLLPEWLGPTIGDKLLEYLIQFKEPKKIINLSEDKGWQTGEEAHVAAGLINLFYQLPLGEGKFVESLVTVTIQLEDVLPFYHLMNCNESPFLLPLVKYLNRFAVVSINFFLSRKYVSVPSFSSLFLRAIESRESTELRNALSTYFMSYNIFFACFLDIIKQLMDQLGHLMVPGADIIANALSQFEIVAGSGGIYVNGQVSMGYKAAELALVKALQFPLSDTALLAKILTPKSERLKLISSWQLPNQGNTVVSVQLFGLSLVHAAIKFKPGYLASCPVIVVTIRHLWRQVVLQGLELRHELDDPYETRHVNIVKELKLLLECLICIYESDPSNMDVLLEILVVFITPDLHLIDLTFVLHFFRYRVHALTSNAQKKSLFTMSMSMICDSQWNEEAKIQCLKVLIIPCLTEAFEDPKVSNLEIVDAPLISLVDFATSPPKFVKDVLGTVMPSTRGRSCSVLTDTTTASGGSKEGGNLSEERRLGPGDLKGGEVTISSLPPSQSNRNGGWSCSEFLRIELLKLGTLMIEFLSAIMVDHRRELIKFAWHQLRAEDSISKQWAYINVCQFISMYDTPSKIILQVYVALLRIHQPEVKHLVQTALDILVPSLPRRLIYNDFIKAIKWTKKIMYEDGYSLSQLIHMWQLVVRNPVLFYTYRGHFIPQMVNSLNRLGLPPNCPLENRQLAFALVDIMVGWEIHHKQRAASRLFATPINSNQEPRGMKRPANGSGSLASTTTKIIKSSQTSKDKMMSTAMPSPSVTTPSGAVASRSTVHDATATEPPPFSSGQSTYSAPAPHGSGGNEGSTTDIATLSAAQYRTGFQQEDSFCLSPQMVEMILNFLVRMTLLAAGSRESEMVELSKQCLGLLSKVLKTWPKCIFVKYVYFEKHLHSPIEYALQHQGSGAASSTVFSSTTKNASGSARHAHMDKQQHMNVQSNQGQQPKGSESSSSSSLANAAKQHSAGNASTKDTKKLNLMETGLKVIILLIKGGHPNFLESNASSLVNLIPWYFMHNVPSIKEELKTFCILICKLFPPFKTNLPDGLVHLHTTLKYTIEQRIFLAVNEKPAAVEPMMGQVTRVSYPNGRTTAGIAEPAQSILAAMIKDHPEYAASNATRLVKLLQRLAQDSISAASKKNKAQMPMPHGLSEAFQITALSQTMPTPVIGLLHAASAGAKILKKVEEASVLTAVDMLDTMCSCLRILSAYITSGTVSREDSDPCIQIIGALLDKSTNIPLLTILVEIVTEWLRSTAAPFTDKDRVSLFGKLSRFERLPEIHITHLQDLYHNLLFQLYTGFELYEPGTTDEPVGADKPVMGKNAAKWLALSGNNAFLAGMMSARPSIRKCFVDAFCAAAPGSSLYDLLLFILKQDWSSLGSRFWPCVMVDIFLMRAVRDGDSPFIHSCKFPPVADQVSPVMTKDEQMIMLACRESLYHGSNSGVGKISSLLDPLQGIVHADMFFAEKVLLEVLPLAWKSLDHTERNYCLPAMVSVLSQSSQRPHLHQPPSKAMSLKHYVNSPQSLLRAINAMRPLPVLPPDILGWLAEQYNAWHEVLPIMEYQAMSSSPPIRQEWIQALCRMYSKLGEQDMCSAVVRMFALNPDTRVAVSMETYGFITQAQILYYDCMVAELGEMESAGGNSMLQNVGIAGVPQSPRSGGSKSGCSAMELNAWEERWIECAAGLCQWNVLEEFSTSLQYPDLLLESSCKSHNWDVVRQCMASPTVGAGREALSPALKLYDIYLALIDRKMSDVEKLCTRCVQFSLHQWQLLPRIHSGDSSHKNLFHIFHQLVEIRESSHVVEVSRPVDKTLPDFKSILATWRERRPNRWDKLRHWDDVFCWRMEIFRIIMNSFKFSDPGALACLHDNSWTVIKRAHVARKQGLYEVCLNSLRKLYGVATMDVQDAFEKLREQIILCLSNSSEENGGLNIINNTNLDYFNAQQKAELFRLKGMFLSKLGASQEANHAYSHAMQICGDYGKGWLSWGKYCDSIYAEKSDIQAAGQAIACYLQAISHGCNGAKMTMARVLWILSQNDENGHLGKTLENYGKGISEWVWIPWIPQLLTALTRPEAKHITTFMKPMAIRYPQALYYTLRAFLLEMRELPRSTAKSQAASPKPEPSGSNRGARETTKFSTLTTPSGASVAKPAGIPLSTPKGHASGTATSLPSPQPPTAGSMAAPPKTFSKPPTIPREMMNGAHHSEDIMSVMRRANLGLAAQMEGILEETILHFRSEPAEELLSAVCSLSMKCFQLLSARQGDEVPSSLRFTLARVCNKFFKATQNSGRPAHRAFALRFKDDFERDFHIGEYSQAQQQQPETERAVTSPRQRKGVPTLADVVMCLKKWKRLLQVVVSSVPSKTPLRHSSAFLARLQGEVETWNSGNRACVEIPGQYLKSFEEPKPELHAMLLRFDSQVIVHQKQGATMRCLGMLASNGHMYYFNIMFAIPQTTRTDERMVQLHTVVEELLGKHVQARRRDLVIHAPSVVPITPRMRLIENSLSYVSLGEVYEASCRRSRRDPDEPVIYCQRAINQKLQKAAANGPIDATMQSNIEGSVKYKIFTETCANVVKSDLLYEFVVGHMDDAEAIWAFKRTFAQQLGVSSLLCYALAGVERFPHRIVFDCKTAHIISYELCPGYTTQGYMEPTEAVPFRLTRNLTKFLAPFHVDGVMVPAIVSLAQALMDKVEVFRPYLSLVLRDDLLSYYSSKHKSGPPSELEQRNLEKQLSDRMSKNVNNLLRRIESVTPKLDDRNSNGQRIPCDSKVYTLIDAASYEGNLVRMIPTWHPWL